MQQVRWANALRAATIAAAIVAVLAALPTLLGAGGPPRPPADVGLATVPAPAPPPPVLPGSPLPAARAAGRREKRVREREQEHGDKGSTPQHERPKRSGKVIGSRRGRAGSERDRGSSSTRPITPQASYAPGTPGPVAIVQRPPPRGGFGFER